MIDNINNNMFALSLNIGCNYKYDFLNQSEGC